MNNCGSSLLKNASFEEIWLFESKRFPTPVQESFISNVFFGAENTFIHLPKKFRLARKNWNTGTTGVFMNTHKHTPNTGNYTHTLTRVKIRTHSELKLDKKNIWKTQTSHAGSRARVQPFSRSDSSRQWCGGAVFLLLCAAGTWRLMEGTGKDINHFPSLALPKNPQKYAQYSPSSAQKCPLGACPGQKITVRENCLDFCRVQYIWLQDGSMKCNNKKKKKRKTTSVHKSTL